MYDQPNTPASRLRGRAAQIEQGKRTTSRPAPEMRGELLATIPRGDSTELRIVRDEFKGFPFVSLRVWNSLDDVWYPDVKRGVTIRPRELPDVLAALGRAASALENDGGGR